MVKNFSLENEKNFSITGTVGDRIRQVRGSETQTTFAERLGITQRAVVNYETGGRVPKKSVLGKMSEQYGVNTDWLLTGEGEKLLPGSSFSEKDNTQQPEIIDSGEKKLLHGVENRVFSEDLQLGFAASRPAEAATGEAAPGPAAAPRSGSPAAPAAAPDLAAQLVAALRENAALLRELGDLRVREVEQRVELERLRAELASARARCALLEERENGSG